MNPPPKTSRRRGTQNPKPPEKESDIQRTILEYLKYSGLFFWRNQTGAVVRFGQLVRYGAIGSPDIFVMKPPYWIGLEVKNAKNEQSREQSCFQHDFEKAGGKYAVVRSLQETILFIASLK